MTYLVVINIIPDNGDDNNNNDNNNNKVPVAVTFQSPNMWVDWLGTRSALGVA